MITRIEKFGAEWCGPCKILDATLEKVKDVEVVKYDVDEVDEAILAERSIRNIPQLFFINESGKIVHHVVGAISLDRINEILNKFKNE